MNISQNFFALCSFLILFLNHQPVSSQESDMDIIDRFIETTMSSGNIPGLSLSIVKDGKIYVTKGYGKTRLDENAEDVTENTLFYIASTTKAITSALLGQLMHESTRYTLDTPVREIMPLFHLSELYRQELVSVKDLLSHNTGVLDSLYNWMLGGDVNTRKQSVEYARFFNPIYPLRGRTYYNNLMYTAAGLLIEYLEEAGHKTWEEAMIDRIFMPLGMNDTGFMNFLTPEQETRLATPYETNWRNLSLREVEKRFFHKVHIGAPAGSVVSSAKDIVKWLYALTNDGKNVEGFQVIDPDVLKETTHPVSINGPRGGDAPLNFTGETYGMGWYTGFDRGYRKCDHSGYMYGYHSRATFYPDSRFAIMTLANGQSLFANNLEIINDFIGDLFLFGNSNAKIASIDSAGRDHFQSSMTGFHDFPFDIKILAEIDEYITEEKALGKSAKRHKVKNVPFEEPSTLKELEEYPGTYGNFYAGNATLSLIDNRLVFTYGDFTSLSLYRLENISADTFVGFFDDPLFFFPPVRMFFGRNAQGEVFNVSFPIMLPSDPTIFVRNLRMSEAPPPLEPVTCATESPTTPTTPVNHAASIFNARNYFVIALLSFVLNLLKSYIVH